MTLEEHLARAMRADDPAAALRAASDDPALDPETRSALRAVDEDGVRVQALLVARLRFERLLAGSAEAIAWFERDPAGFAQAFRRYHREVAMTAWFPAPEARLFERWRASRDDGPRRGSEHPCVAPGGADRVDRPAGRGAARDSAADRVLASRPMGSAAEELRRFTADEYLRMIDAGVLSDGDRVELVDGEILTVAPQGPEHRSMRVELRERLEAAYRELTVHVDDQGPLRAGDRGVPEPDLAVIRGRPRDYLQAHPRGEDALLVVELAKTSLARDRAKAADYARGAVPVYWLLDLEARVLEVHTRPDAGSGRYRSVAVLREDESVELPGLDAISWRVATMLP